MAQTLKLKNSTIEGVTLALGLDLRGTHRTKEIFPIAVTVNYNRNTYYYRTGLKVTPEEWEKICDKKKSKSVEYKTQQEQIKIFEKVKSVVKDLTTRNLFNFDNLKMNLTGKGPFTLLGMWDNVIESQREVNTARAYDAAKKCFISCLGEKKDWRDVGTGMVRLWTQAMEGNGMSTASIGMHLRAFRVVLNRARQEGFLKESQYPFGADNKGKVRIPKCGTPRANQFIDIETINKIRTYNAPNLEQEFARDMWLFSYLAGGMNVRDMATLEWNRAYFQSGCKELSFIRCKTKNTTDAETIIYIAINSEMRRILELWGSEPVQGNRVFPSILQNETNEERIARRTQQTNQNIRKNMHRICKALELPQEVGPTWARHSFKTNSARQRIPREYTEQLMGHITGVESNYLGQYTIEQRIEFANALLGEQKQTTQKETITTDLKELAGLTPEQLSKLIELKKVMGW